jgi:uncharacterized protein YbjT (DUF2867 family)
MVSRGGGLVIGVTGATGQIGGRVARLLADAGLPQRLLVRDLSRAPALARADVVVAGSYGDGDTVRRALEGVNVLLMISAQESADRLTQHRAFIDAAADAGVRQIVYTSFLGASPTATFTLARDHWTTEDHIRASGMDSTFLRDNLYMDMIPLFAADGVIRGPAGTGRVSAVARADVARVAAEALRDPARHAGRTYELTGAEALSLEDVACMITTSTGQPVHYHDETVEEAYASRAEYGAPDWQVEAWVSTYLAIRNGEMERVTSDVQMVTGAPPMSFRQFIAGNHPSLR